MQEFEKLDDNAKIWIYPSNKELNVEEQNTIHREIADFTLNWDSHGEKLHAYSKIIDDHFVIIGLKPTESAICGGAIDSSFRFMKQLGEKLKIDFLNRMQALTIDENDNKEFVHFSELRNFPDRKTYNITLTDKANLDKNFKVKVSEYLGGL